MPSPYMCTSAPITFISPLPRYSFYWQIFQMHVGGTNAGDPWALFEIQSGGDSVRLVSRNYKWLFFFFPPCFETSPVEKDVGLLHPRVEISF